MPPYDRKHPFLARLTQRYALTQPESNKQIMHAVVDLSGSELTYCCGDSLGIYVENEPSEVSALLDAAGLSAEIPVSTAQNPQARPLREVLTSNVDIGTPGPGFIRLLWQHAAHAQQAAELQQWLEGPPEALKAWIASKTYTSLLAEYPVRLEAQALASHLRRLQPRLYSIASSPTQSPHQADLTISVLRYTVDEQPRIGVASTYLSERCPLNAPVLPVFIAPSSFRLPENDDATMIMIGPGTGVAPFMGFLKERQARKASGLNWLFFGEQQRKYDFIYESTLVELQKSGVLTHLDTAFSRDQAHKIYVQHRMQAASERLWDWIHHQKAYLYVCGDAKRMAPDVQNTLLSIFNEKLGPDNATQYLKSLKEQNRYQRDVY